MTQIEQNFFEAATKYCREHSTDIHYNKQIDWEQRRYEIARDMMSAFLSNSTESVYSGTMATHAKLAVEFADALINELKKNEK
mgnify:FL=1